MARRWSLVLGLVLVACWSTARSENNPAAGKVVIFRQPGFPSVDSPPLTQNTLAAAFGPSALFADVQALQTAETLHDAVLLVLPYGSAFPLEDWSAISAYLHDGGNLLLIGGQALRVPVAGDGRGAFVKQAPQDSFSRQIGFLHTYALSLGSAPLHPHWRKGYDFFPALSPELAPAIATLFVEEGRLNGLAYLDAADGTQVAAPIIVADRRTGAGASGNRIVALPFNARPGFWASAAGVSLLKTTSAYAQAGTTSLALETQYAALRPGEQPKITVHLRGGSGFASSADKTAGEVHVDLLRGNERIDTATLPLTAGASTEVPFTKALPKGVYMLKATWRPAGAAAPLEAAENGFIVEDLNDLETGAAFSVAGDFLRLGDQPFLPVGTNYFSTEANGWDFSGPRNDAVWESDFADMQRHNVNFVRTGVWGGYGKIMDPATGGANERFLRNLEGYLAAAHRHGIVVNFTFFAFSPRVTDAKPAATPETKETASSPPPNPYLDPTARSAERAYVLSVISRFGKVPWLSYDLINEPSFSNPRVIFRGNVPNGDPAEVIAWHTWLRQRYITLDALADAWRVTPNELRSFDTIDLPRAADLNYERNGNANDVRAFDYNLFAQEMFSGWVRFMVDSIRGAGSRQLINVGQDEGGVSNRLLNQFYATAGVSFTTNHTYWNDDALLWDSVAAKRPGMPNITGETGYQPVWNPDGTWRYDEQTGTAIEERKWVLGFAAGSSGAVQWDWDREVDFGMERSDGSAKPWEAMMAELGEFARAAAPRATAIELPQVAVILPQTLQLSVLNNYALEAQQTAIRVLYGFNHVEAYAVGEYQTETLGTPKLILLPSAMALSEKAWADIEAHVRAGAVLLLTGPFDADVHLHATDRATRLGLPYAVVPLAERYQQLDLPSGPVPLEYAGAKTTALDRARLPDGKTWTAISLGKGHVLFSALPLELNSNLDSIAAAYSVALKLAGVTETYTTTTQSPGIMIAATRLPEATLYAITSETEATAVEFKDTRSGRQFTGRLAPGHGALLLIGRDGRIEAKYNWQ